MAEPRVTFTSVSRTVDGKRMMGVFRDGNFLGFVLEETHLSGWHANRTLTEFIYKATGQRDKKGKMGIWTTFFINQPEDEKMKEQLSCTLRGCYLNDN